MLAAYWRLVRDNRNFRRLWLAQLVSEIGDWFYALAIYNLLLELTGRSTLMGLALVVQLLPQTLMTPTAGVVNDRVRRKGVMISTDLARVAIVLGMLLVRTRSTVWLVFPLLFLKTIMTAFFEPARNAVLPNITTERELLLANTLYSATWSFSLASALLIVRMRFTEPHLAGAPPFRARELVDFSPILEGVRYIRSDRRLLSTVFVKFGLGFVGASNVILPIMGERVFPVKWAGIAPERSAMLGMSLLVGARGVGALLGPVVSGRWAGDRDSRLRLGILIGFLVAACGYMGVGLAPSIWIAVACVVVANCGTSTNWVFSTTLLQKATEDRFRGRVFSADMGLLTLTISISSFVAGQCHDWGVPVRVLAFANGAIALLPAAAWALALGIGRRRAR